MKIRSLIAIGLAAACGVLTGACTVGTSVRFAPQSHYVFPGQDIKPIGNVSVSEVPIPGGIGFFMPKAMSAKMEKQLYDKAIASSPGADLIVDYVQTSKIQMIAFPPIVLFLTTYSLEGTAAKTTGR